MNSHLTATEKNLIINIGLGLRIKQVSSNLKLSATRTYTIRHIAYRKMGFKSDYDAIIFCIKNRWIEGI